ncbi:hypothetical protein CDL15_Pgr014670 [Punica granatum]|nr:hypothetical protein CDL15_Pgr014670 [Punica granatum]
MNQAEVSSPDRIIFPESSSRNPLKSQSGAHLQDVHEDSTRDSLRSSWQEQPINGPADLKESLRVLAKLRETPRHFDEDSEDWRSSYGSACLAPWLSFDGEESGRLSFGSRETITKPKDLPRISLDSRECAVLGSSSCLKQSPNSKDLLENIQKSKGQVKDVEQSSGSQKRHASVVAKLMGLEAFPDSVRPIGTSDSARRPKSGGQSPSWKIQDSATNNISCSRLPIELVPLKQQKGGNGESPNSSGSKPVEVPNRQSESLHSVYGEIERRLKVFEFKCTQSEKDLGAVKQILEAIRRKGLLETQRGEECPTDSESREGYQGKYMRPKLNLELAKSCGPKNSHMFSSAEQESDYPRNIESTILIMKPAKLVERDGAGVRTLNSRVMQNGGIAKDQSRVDSSNDSPARQSHEGKSTLGGKVGSNLPNNSSSLGSDTIRESKARRFSEDGLLLEEAIPVLAHKSSPVSVLDVSESTDDSSSPVKKTLNSLGEHCDRDNENKHEADSLLEISRKKLQNVRDLIQKLERLCSTNDEESTDYVAQLCECENPNPDQKYICKILVSSGILLRDLGSGLSTFQLHPSGNPFDPNLFLVLERRKNKNSGAMEEDTSRRRIIFDSVNEILGRKVTGSGIVWHKLVEETLTAQKLLKELCHEIELLEANTKKPRNDDPESRGDGCLRSILWEDVMRGEDKWTCFCRETYDLVTDLEDVIFQELIDEIGITRKAGPRTNSS